LTYQWYSNSTALVAATNNTYSIASAQPADAASYGVVASSSCGGSISNSALLTINTPVVQLGPIADQTVCAGGSASFTVSAGGSNLVYAWYYSSTNNPVLATTPTLLLNNLTTPQSGAYIVRVAGSCGSPVFASANLTVNPLPLAPTIATNQFGCAGITNPTLAVLLSTPGDGAHWYNSDGSLVTTNLAPFYVPTNSALMSITDPITNRYFVAEVSPAGCESTNRLEVDLVLQPCPTNLTISLVDTNAVLEWYGNYFLQQSFTLTPLNWLTLTQGVGGITNKWTNAVLVPPTNNFFRLYAPTN